MERQEPFVCGCPDAHGATGLGYYTRASRLHSGAKVVVDDYDGVIPSDPAILEKSIPGIGRYSAGAISSIAYGAQAPVVSRFTYWPVRVTVSDADRHLQFNPYNLRVPPRPAAVVLNAGLNGPSIDGRFSCAKPATDRPMTTMTIWPGRCTA